MSVTLKGQQEQHVICTGSVKEVACSLVNTHGAMASPKTKNRRHPLYNPGLSREAAASPEGVLATFTWAGHAMYTVVSGCQHSPPPLPPCLYIWREAVGGREHKQTVTRGGSPFLWF